jgi:hypothetical protein
MRCVGGGKSLLGRPILKELRRAQGEFYLGVPWVCRVVLDAFFYGGRCVERCEGGSV